MKDHVLSKEALQILEENEYKVRWKNKSLTIKKGIGDRILIVSLTVLFNGLAFGLMTLDVWFGVGLFVVINLGAAGAYSKTTGRTFIRLDFMVGFLKIGSRNLTFADIDSVLMDSKFVDEYSSAHKETNKEYHVDITLFFKDEQYQTILTFVSGYPEPTFPMMEIKNLLENLSKIRRDLQ